MLPRYKRLPWIPSEDEWQGFLEQARHESIRNRCMLALAYDAGLRREELCCLATQDLQPAHRVVRIRAETSKSRQDRIVPYSETSGVLLVAYLAHRRTLSRERGPLFLSESHRNRPKPLTRWTWSRVIRRLADAAHLPRFSTHTLRHVCLTDLARAGWDLHEIARFAGHRHVSVTQQYVHLSGRELASKLADGMAQIHEWRTPTLSFGGVLSIVGVVGDVNQATQQAGDRASSIIEPGTAYLLFSGQQRRPPSWVFLVVRTTPGGAAVPDAVVHELLLVDNQACLGDPRTFAQLFARKVAERRRILGLVGGFALVVLLVTALSLTSALAQFVASHEHDLAIRRALGASRGRVLVLASRHLSAALAIGLIAGGAGSFWLGNALTSQLYGIVPWDPPTLVAAVAGLAILAAVAAAGPLWRATRIDPARALRAL